MKKLRFILSFIFFLVPTVYAFNFSDFYFLGDSLSDVGNGDSAPYSNGLVWTELLASKYGKSVTASDKGGNNYAHGGARTDYTSPGQRSGHTNRGLLSQVDEILAQHPKLDGNALYSVWAGGNDLLEWVSGGGDYNQVVNEATNNLSAAMTKLHNAGARYIILGNLTDISETPLLSGLSPEEKKAIALVSRLFDSTLLTKVNSLGFKVIQVDYYGLFDDIVHYGSKFGFSHPYNEICPTSNGTVRDCSGYIFSDGVHPTQQAYQVVADYNYSIVTAPNYYAYLAETPLRFITSADNAIQQQLKQQDILSALNKNHTFITGDYEPHTVVPYDGDRIGNRSHQTNVVVGGFMPFNDRWLLGGALSYVEDVTHLASSVFSYETNSPMLSIFAQYHWPRFYVSGFADGGILRYVDIERKVSLGSNTFVVKGSSSGRQLGLGLDSGYWFSFANFRTGPVINAYYKYISVDGYTETGNTGDSYARINYGDQNNESLVTGIGWQADYKRLVKDIVVTSSAYVTGNHDWYTRDRDIDFHVESLSGSKGSLPINTATTSYMVANATLGLTFNNGITTTLGYVGMFGSHHLENNSFNIGVSTVF